MFSVCDGTLHSLQWEFAPGQMKTSSIQLLWATHASWSLSVCCSGTFYLRCLSGRTRKLQVDTKLSLSPCFFSETSTNCEDEDQKSFCSGWRFQVCSSGESLWFPSGHSGLCEPLQCYVALTSKDFSVLNHLPSDPASSGPLHSPRPPPRPAVWNIPPQYTLRISSSLHSVSVACQTSQWSPFTGSTIPISVSVFCP